MMPIARLMIEHRLIERVVALLRAEMERMSASKQVNAAFVETAVDFFRTYADAVHHGKEEDILFDALTDKDLSSDHHDIMSGLVEEHVEVRKLVGQLLLDKERAEQGDESALNDVLAGIRVLIALYPSHVRREDQDFFRPAMDYFTEQEQTEMLAAFDEFDRRQIHAKYQRVVEDLEQARKER